MFCELHGFGVLLWFGLFYYFIQKSEIDLRFFLLQLLCFVQVHFALTVNEAFYKVFHSLLSSCMRL